MSLSTIVESRTNKIAILRRFVEGLNDQQHLRIITGNRLVAQFRDRLSIAEADQDDADKAIKQIKEQYHRYTDGVVDALGNGELPCASRLRKKIVLPEGGVFSDVNELYLVQSYLSMVTLEGQLARRLNTLMEGIPIYDHFLSKVPGCGPISSAYVLSYLDPYKAKYPSSFWKYAGFDVAQDGRGRGRFKEHLVPHVATKQDGSTREFMGISFQAKLKPKLYLLATCFVKVKGSKYNEAYYNYKERLSNRIDTKPILVVEDGSVISVSKTIGATEPGRFTIAVKSKDELSINYYNVFTKGESPRVVVGDKVKKGDQIGGLTKSHAHNRALRYIVKLFLSDLHLEWRRLECLPIPLPYHEAKLGLHHGIDA